MDAGFPADVVAAARDAVKAHVRAAGDGEDALIGQYAASALALCEAYTGQALILRERVQTVRADGGWHRLDLVPVSAIETVERLDAAGEAGPLATGDHAIDIDGNGEGWVRASGVAARLRVTYLAGLAVGWDALPAGIAQGVVLLTAHLASGATGEPPAAVVALWRPWRRLRLATERVA